MRFIFIMAMLWSAPSAATGIYQEPADFIAEAFNSVTPEPKMLWITADLKPAINAIMGHDLSAMRVRYWSTEGRSAWILEEIGKDKPITVGLVVAGGRLERVKVLAFRESRGWEVRNDFFTRQFIGAGLTESRDLDRHIDGITGATLSVRALTKLARLAIFLDRHSDSKHVAP